MEELEGVVENIIFASPDGHFAVFRLRPEHQNGLVNVTVNAPAPLIGQLLTLKGQWIVHPRFGEQFKVEHMLAAAPSSAVPDFQKE